MSFYTYMTRVLADMCDTWDAAGAEAVVLLSPDEEIDKAFSDIQSKADRADAIHAIPAFRLLQLEE